MHISDCCQFSDIHISQDSVATYLRCGGIFKYEFVANLPMSLPVKDFENRLTVGEVMSKSLVSCFFETQCRRISEKRPPVIIKVHFGVKVGTSVFNINDAC